MTPFTRRSFLTGLGAVPAVPFAAHALALPSMRRAPVSGNFTLWGDGIHDDAPAINALLAGTGRVTTPRGAVLTDARLENSYYLVRRTIVVPAGATFTMHDCRLTAAADFTGESLFFVQEGGALDMRDSAVDANGAVVIYMQFASAAGPVYFPPEFWAEGNARGTAP